MSQHDAERHKKVILSRPPRSRWFPGVVQCQGRHDYEDSYADELVAQYWRPVLTIVAVGLSLRWLGKRLTGTRYETAAHIPPDVYSKQTWIRGRVTSVGDSDNFRLYHTPGFGWGWLRKVPNTRKELKDQTIAVRIAGVDAPEGAHFGMPAQPFSAESKTFLTKMVLGRNVHVQLLSLDRYSRAVCMVELRRPPFFFRKNVSVEMCKAGMASIYTAKGAEYGNHFEALQKAQARAQ
ncbi:hypothetical protein BCR43DRAFT_434868 [Syncephalastrum racemosum]|uniref:TNase-like domain-containing protein n=1 Tax=Syncephalastrum racemosum TaxID=13706 RepID=A0A1X2HLV1_SYNRA|nr:hypothetical protein BCR43DRAFT_434868 [Syncephalastrum racemosum]